MITAAQAENGHYFHVNGECSLKLGTRGRIMLVVRVWRRNGKTVHWHNSGWRVPLKHGMYSYGEVNSDTADKFHLEKDCAVLKEAQRIRELDSIELGDLIEAKYSVTN